MTKKLSKEAAELLPFIAGKIGGGTKTINVTNTGGGDGEGVSDHGDLTGLSDDDHTQYFNTARGDARYLQLADKAHDVTDGDFHTTTAAAGYVLGTSGAQTLGMLATTADGAANHSTLLKSSASGGLTLDQLTAPALISANFAAPDPFTTGFSLHPYPEDSTKHRLQIGRIEADELIVKLFTADETRVRRGSDWLVPDEGTVARDEYNGLGEYTVPAEDGTVNIWFEDSVFGSGALFAEDEWVMIQHFERGSGLYTVEIWGQVSSYTTDGNHDDQQRWTFTNRTSGVSGLKIKPGDLVMGFGSSGDGWIYRTVLSGGPREKFVTWSGSNPRDGTQTLRVQVGDLSDVSGSNLSPSGYGLYGSNVFLEGDFYAAAGDVVMTGDGTSWKADTVEASTWTDYGNKISWMVDPLDPVEGEVVAQMWATRYTASSDTIGDWWLRVKAGGSSELTDGHLYLTAENAGYAALIAVNIDNNDPTVLISAGDSTGLTEYASINVGGRANEVVVQGDAFAPEDNEGTDLGTATHNFGTIFVKTLNAGTEVIAGTLTGATWGDSDNQAMYIDNGYAAADSTLYLRNTETGRSAHLNVEGNGVFGGSISVGGTVDGVDIADLSTDFSSHQVSGAHTALDITNNADIGGTLGVTGAATLSSTLAVTGTLTASGAATVGTTLGVTGAATFGSTVGVTGTLTASGALTVGGSMGVTGTITGSDTISGTSLLASSAFIGGVLRPASDSTTALKLANSSGTAVLTVDTITPSITIDNELVISGSAPAFNVVGSGNTQFSIRKYQDSIYAPEALFYRARGTSASPTAVTTGDYLGTFSWEGLRSGGYETIFAELIAQKESTARGASLAITTANTSIPQTRLKIWHDGGITSGSTHTATPGASIWAHYGALEVTGDATFDADIVGSIIRPATNSTTALNLTKADGSTSVLTVDTSTPSVDITGALDVTGAATVSSTLGVTGVATLSNNATVGGTLGVTGTLTASGAATVGTTLGVSGATTLNSTLGVTGKITGSDDLTLAGTFDGPQIDIKSGGTTYGRIDSTGITSVTPAFTSGDNAQGWKVTWDGHLTAREVTAVTLSSFVFEMRQVHAIGSTLIVTPAGRLNAAATMPSSVGGSSTFQLRNPDGEEGRIFQTGDVLRISAVSYGNLQDSGESARLFNPALFYQPSAVLDGAMGISTVWLTVTDATAADGYWTYSYTLSDGATNVIFPAGTAVVKWGQDGDGLIRISSDDYDGYTPYMAVSTVTSTPWTGDVDIIRLGRIDGLGLITGGQQYGLAISTDWSDNTAPQFVASTVGGMYTKNLTQQLINDDGETAIYLDPDVGLNFRVFDNVVANSTLAWMEDATDTPSGLGGSSSNVLFGLSCNIDTDPYTSGTPRLGPYARMAVHGQSGDTESTLVIDATTTHIEDNGLQNQASGARITMIADSNRGSSISIGAANGVSANNLSTDVFTADTATIGDVTVTGTGGQPPVFRIDDCPTSSTGLPSGAIYSDGGTLKIVS